MSEAQLSEDLGGKKSGLFFIFFSCKSSVKSKGFFYSITTILYSNILAFCWNSTHGEKNSPYWKWNDSNFNRKLEWWHHGRSSISSSFSKWMVTMFCSHVTVKNIGNIFKELTILVLYFQYKISSFQMQAAKTLNCP